MERYDRTVNVEVTRRVVSCCNEVERWRLRGSVCLCWQNRKSSLEVELKVSTEDGRGDSSGQQTSGFQISQLEGASSRSYGIVNKQ